MLWSTRKPWKKLEGDSYGVKISIPPFMMTILAVVKDTTYQMVSDNWGKPIPRSLKTIKLPVIIWNYRRSKKVSEDYKIVCSKTPKFLRSRHLERREKTNLHFSRQIHSFSIKRSCQNLKQGSTLHPLEAPSSFTRIFDAAYKTHFTNIRDEIELLPKHQTPLEYVYRNTPDITNLYYFNDDGTAVQEAL